MTLTMKDLTTKAVLVSLSFTQWTAKKYDRRAEVAVEKETGAHEKAGRYRKSLTAQNKALAELNSAFTACRDYFKDQTRAWNDADGYRICPSKHYMELTNEIGKHFSNIENKLAVFVEQYDQMKADAKPFLGGLYNEDDYPSASRVKALYSWKLSVMPVPNINDFRVTQITDEDVEFIRKQLADQMEQVNKNLATDLWERLHTVLDLAYQAFADPDAKFKDSKITNIAETITTLRKLSLEDDPTLDRFCKLIESRICNLDPAELRKEPEARQDAADDAKKLLDAMAAYC